MKEVKLHLDYAGFCWAKENHAIRTGERKKIKYMALWGLIKHPEEGLILIDSGYSRRFYEETRKFPNKIYGLITRVEVNEADEIKTKLIQNNIDPKSIKKILLTHFHADHIGGLKDFPNAAIFTSKEGYHQVKSIHKNVAFSKGILPGLLPESVNEKLKFIEELNEIQTPYFNRAWDLFGDNSILLYDLPGHAKGQYGVKISTNKKDYLLVADAVWLSRSLKENTLPNKLVRLIIDSWADFKSTFKAIQEYAKDHPNHLIIPTHCKETTDPLISNTIDFDKL